MLHYIRLALAATLALIASGAAAADRIRLVAQKILPLVSVVAKRVGRRGQCN
jgi:hypothetical protein